MRAFQLGQLMAMPLQSAVRAQNLAFQEAISLIEQVYFEEGTAKTFRFITERMVEEREVDPKTGVEKTRLSRQPVEVSIPLLALIQPPSINLQEMNVEFGVEIVEPRAEPIKFATISPTAPSVSLASSRALFTSLGQSNPTTMKINMKIVKEIPEGMARIGDMLTDMLSSVPPAEPPVPSPPQPKAAGPVLQTPRTGSVGVGPVALGFKWTPIAGVSEYEFILAKDAALTDVIIQDTVTSTTYGPVNLDYGADYFYAVRATAPTPSAQSIASFTTMSPVRIEPTLPTGVDFKVPGVGTVPESIAEISVKDLSGIGPQRAELLSSRGIRTAAEFIEATKTAKLQEELSKALKVSQQMIQNWGAQAKILEKGKK